MRPIILGYAVERINDGKPIYEYDYFDSLNVIQIGNLKKPFIDSNSKDLSLLIETKQAREDNNNDLNILELSTTTRTYREQDDDYDMLIELKTKTLTDRERDDEDSYNF